MSYNGSGQFLINSTGQPVVANTVISATVFNALTADLATGLSTAITKDGQTTITANIPFGNNKITGLAAGTAATDSANLGQVQSTAAKLITVSGTDTITGTMTPQLTAYAAGQLFYFVANGANTGAVTINIDGLGAKSITRDGATTLAAGDINSGEFVVVIYDGTRFQMINAANSFGNTTINGTLTVTGNTGLQANVSITSALSVGGTFNVTGAAALDSTLAVTGKSDLPTVSTASINAAVALITTGTVTNLTATGASIASANIGNLQFTAASIASINAGVAVVTNLTATGASIASANVGTAVVTTGTVTNLTSTSASIASANAAVALVTTGTVTNLTSTAASIASANLGAALVTTGTVTNLTSTSASIASANAGTAVITNLTATGASVASANVGTAVVTGLTVTNASIASLNAGTATVTTGNLTFSSTAQRITGDTSNATIGNRLAVQNSVTNGNTVLGLLPNGTATTSALQINNNSDTTAALGYGSLQVSTTEFQIAAAIRNAGTYLPMTFYTGGSERMRLTTAGDLGIGVTPSAWSTSFRAFEVGKAGAGIAANTSNSNINLISGAYLGTGGWVYTNNSYAAYYNIAASSGVHAWYTAPSGTAGNAITFTQAMTLDTSGNLGIGGTASAFSRLEIMGTLPTSSNSTQSVRQAGTLPSGSTSDSYGYVNVLNTAAASFTCTGYSHYFAFQSTLGAGSAVTNQYGFHVGSSLTSATNNYGFYSNIASGSNRFNFYANGTADNYFAGNVGIGTAPSYTLDVYRSGTNTSVIVARNDNSVAQLYSTSSSSFTGTNTNTPFGFITNNTERMRITATGNIVAGASAALATTATDGFLYVPTCAGTPTGTPTAITGMAPIVVDTTNNKLYFYSGGQWRDAGP